MMRILIAHISSFSLWTAPKWFGERLQQEFPQHHVVQLESYDTLPREIVEAEVYVGMSLRCEQFESARQLRWIHSPAAAVHQLMYPEVVRSQVLVTNAASVHGPVVAEHALAQILALAKGFHRAGRFQQKRLWAKCKMWDEDEHARPREIQGATVLIVGMGQIGNHLGRACRALGMTVIGVREHPERGGEADEVHGSSALPSLLPRAHFVVLAAPVTDASRALIGSEAIAKMRPDAYLVNVSRGELVDEAALTEALRAGQLAGAALDVFAEEPLPEDSPLWDLDRLLITPHTAGFSEKMWERHYQLLAENLRRYESHLPLLNLVNKTSGY